MNNIPLRDTILTAIRVLRHRRVRPSLQKIAWFVRRENLLKEQETFDAVNQLVETGDILKVVYKGATSYRVTKSRPKPESWDRQGARQAVLAAVASCNTSAGASREDIATILHSDGRGAYLRELDVQLQKEVRQGTLVRKVLKNGGKCRTAYVIPCKKENVDSVEDEKMRVSGSESENEQSSQEPFQNLYLQLEQMKREKLNSSDVVGSASTASSTVPGSADDSKLSIKTSPPASVTITPAQSTSSVTAPPKCDDKGLLNGTNVKIEDCIARIDVKNPQSKDNAVRSKSTAIPVTKCTDKFQSLSSLSCRDVALSQLNSLIGNRKCNSNLYAEVTKSNATPATTKSSVVNPTGGVGVMQVGATSIFRVKNGGAKSGSTPMPAVMRNEAVDGAKMVRSVSAPLIKEVRNGHRAQQLSNIGGLVQRSHEKRRGRPPSQRAKKARKVFDPSEGSGRRKSHGGADSNSDPERSYSPISTIGSSQQSSSNDACDVCCLGNQSKLGYDELLACHRCTAKAHPSCLGYSNELAIRSRQKPWTCMDCKHCSICDLDHNAGTLIFCDECDKAYHLTCHRPSLESQPQGTWICCLCCPYPDDCSQEYKVTTTTTSVRGSPVDENSIGSGCSLGSSCENGIPDATTWTVANVYDHFATKGFMRVSDVFKEQDIDGTALLLLTRADVLGGLGIKLGPALKVYKQIRILQTRMAEPTLA